MKNLLLYTCITLLLLSCSDKNSTDIPIINVDVSSAKVKNLNDYFTINRIIPLETNESYLVDHIIRTHVKQNRIYFLNSYTTPKISIFDRDGNFINEIFNFGQGPEEFMYIIDFDTDKDGNLLLMVPDKKAIMIYDEAGGFMGSKKNEIILHFKWWQNTYNAIPGIFSTEMFNVGKYNMFYRLTNNMKLMYSYKPYPEQIANTNDARCHDIFWEYNNKLGCILPYTDTLFYVGDKKLEPAYTINFMNQKANYMDELLKWNGGPAGFAQSLLADGKAIHPVKVFESDSILFFGFEYQEKNKLYWCVYDKTNNTSEIISDFKHPLFQENSWEPIAYRDDKVYCTLEPYEIIQLIKQGKLDKKYVEKFTGIKSSDNPIIVELTFK